MYKLHQISFIYPSNRKPALLKRRRLEKVFVMRLLNDKTYRKHNAFKVTCFSNSIFIIFEGMGTTILKSLIKFEHSQLKACSSTFTFKQVIVQNIGNSIKTDRSGHRRCSVKIGAPKNIGNFTGKHLEVSF